MSLYRLEKKYYSAAGKFYLQEKFRFPLIAAVINGQQNGTIYTNDASRPDAFFVTHKFGFSQIFGQTNQSFFNSLQNHLFIKTAFKEDKIRVYSPNHYDFFYGHAELSERCQFRLNNRNRILDKKLPEDICIIDATHSNAEIINEAFDLDLFNRFWDSKADFLAYGMGKIATFKDQFASICYAAAVADGTAEIDVATAPTYRKQGFGRIACTAFISACLNNNLSPNWDCFTNNTPSVQLSQCLGFQAYHEPYHFFTLKKIHEETNGTNCNNRK